MPAALERFIAHIFSGFRQPAEQTTGRDTTIIVGAGEEVRLLAAEMVKARKRVSLIDTRGENVIDGSPYANLVRGDAVDGEILRRIAGGNVSCVLAATANDKLNLAVCQAAEMTFDSPRLIALVNEKPNEVDFELLGYEVMSLNRAAFALLERPSLTPDPGTRIW